MSATVEAKQVFLGNEFYISQQKVDITSDHKSKAKMLAKQGKTVVYVAIGGVVKGIIAIQDTIRPDAAKTIKQLQDMGLNIALLTGDRPEVAQAIASNLNITQVFAEVKPEAKAEVIQSLQQNNSVAMIGDGINDAPALAQAEVGISLQGSTDVAIATADIVLMKNRLSDIIGAIELSQATVDKIKQNLIWALAYNLFAIPIAAGILLPKYGLLLSPVLAAIAMASSSLIVVTNSLLLNIDKSLRA